MEKQSSQFGVTLDNIKELFKNKPSANGKAGIILFLVGIFLTPVTLAGALWGYIRAYNRFHFLSMPPSLSIQTPVTKAAMALFAILIWVLIIGGVFYCILFQFSCSMFLLFGNESAYK